MRLAICTTIPAEAACLRRWTEAYFAARGVSAELVFLPSPARFRETFCPGRFQGLVIALGDTEGFLAARLARSQDRDCRVVLIDDTDRYAIRGYRIHLSDFLLRPLERGRYFTALDRIYRG